MKNIKLFIYHCPATNKTKTLIISSLIFCLLLISGSVFAQNDSLNAENSVQYKLIQGKADKIVYKLLFNDSNSKGQLVFESKVTKVETIVVENPLRLVIDVYGTFRAKSTNHIVSNSKFISSLRLGAHSDKIRFVIDIIENPAANLSFKLNNTDNSTIIEFNYSTLSDQNQNIAANPEARKEDSKEDITDSIKSAELTAIPEKTATAINTSTPTSTATVVTTATFTATATNSPAATATVHYISPTASIAPSPTITASFTATVAKSPTATRSPSMTATATHTRTSEPTKTASFSPTPTVTNTPTATSIPSLIPTIRVTAISPTNSSQTIKTDIKQDLDSPVLAPTSRTDITLPSNEKAESTADSNSIVSNSADSESQEVIYLSFDYQEPDHMPVVILNTRMRPSYKLVKKDDGTFNLSIADCSVANKSLRLPQFPPQDFLGFRFIQVATKNSSCEILIGVDKGTRVAAFSRENSILIRSIGFASN